MKDLFAPEKSIFFGLFCKRYISQNAGWFLETPFPATLFFWQIFRRKGIFPGQMDMAGELRRQSSPNHCWQDRVIRCMECCTTIFHMSLTLQKEIQMARDLAESARELLAATTDSAGEKVRNARARLGEALESGKDVFDRVSDRAATAARAADGQLRDHPYVPVFVALGLGALLVALLLKGNSPEER